MTRVSGMVGPVKGKGIRPGSTLCPYRPLTPGVPAANCLDTGFWVPRIMRREPVEADAGLFVVRFPALGRRHRTGPLTSLGQLVGVQRVLDPQDQAEKGGDPKE